MPNQDLITIFVAVVATAALIQAGILTGFYILSVKLNRKAEHAIRETETLLHSMGRVVDALEIASTRFAELGMTARSQMHDYETKAEQAEHSWRQKLDQRSSGARAPKPV